MVIVTDEEGMSTVAISDETRRQQEEQIEKTHSKPPVDRGRRRSTGNPPPTASEIDNLYATAMATASNRDEIYRSNSRSSVRSVRKHDSQVSLNFNIKRENMTLMGHKVIPRHAMVKKGDGKMLEIAFRENQIWILLKN